MDATCSKHGDLKFHIDWRTTPRFRPNSRHKFDFGIDLAFRLSWEPLHTPHDSLLLGFILGAAKECLDLGLGRILGNRNLYYHMSSKKLI